MACLRKVLFLMVLIGASVTANAQQYRWSNVDRVVVFSDVHGAYDRLVELLTDASLIDANGDWIAGETHLVSTGDLVDRGPGSRLAMDLLIKLQEQAKTAGGQVHVLMGNHEVLNLIGDLRYVIRQEYAGYAGPEDDELRAAYQASVNLSPEEQESFDKKYPPGFFYHRVLFSPGGVYADWLLSLPFVIVVNDVVYTHAGLSEQVAGKSLEDINNALKAELNNYLEAWVVIREAALEAPGSDFWDRFENLKGWAENPANAEAAPALKNAVTQLLAAEDDWFLADDNPYWYRGLSYCHPLIESTKIQNILNGLGAKTIVIGHTPTRGQVRSRLDGAVIELDTGMAPYYGGRPSALILENGAQKVFYADDETTSTPLPRPRQVGPRKPASLTDDDLETLIKTAEVVSVEEVGMGVTKPKRVTLKQGEVTIRALFRSEDTGTQASGSASNRNRAMNKSDSFKSDLAAYALDRLMGLDLIPVTVAGELEGKPGIYQFWVENSITEMERREKSVPLTPNCSLRDQFDLMNTFDVLIYNEDRNLSNILYERGSFDLVLIDHSRAFRTKSGRPQHLKQAKLLLNEEIVKRLESLTEENLNAHLSPYLERSQIKAVLKRRDQILRGWKGT